MFKKQASPRQESHCSSKDKLVFRKWHDKREISFLLTNVLPSEPARVVLRQRNGCHFNIKKPCVVDIYTSHMGGVDWADQLHSFSHATHGQRKRAMINFRLHLAKQLINGFSQRQRKRRSQKPQQHSVAREAHVSRKRKCVQCSKADRRTPKGYKGGDALRVQSV